MKVPAILLLPAAMALLGPVALARELGSFAVNDYFGIPYEAEPVSFDVTLPAPAPVHTVTASVRPYQVEILEGTPEAVTKARVWVAVNFPFVEREVEEKRGNETVTVKKAGPGTGAERHRRVTIRVDPNAPPTVLPPACRVREAGEMGGVALAHVANDRFQAKVPVGSVTFNPPAPAFEVPGPVVSVSRDGKEWIGTGYLDAMPRIRRVTCTVTSGPVYFESKIVYAFEGNRTYTSRVRLFAAKPYAQLVEDFDVGGQARYVFNYDDWFIDGYFRTGDQKLFDWYSVTDENPAADFVRMKGQKCLTRLVVWTQFNYFGGKQETIGLKAPDPDAVTANYRADVEKYEMDLAKYKEAKARHEAKVKAYTDAMATFPERKVRYQEALEAWKKDPKGKDKPREPREAKEPKPFRGREPREPEKPTYEEITYTHGDASLKTAVVTTPSGGRDATPREGHSTAVGAFYLRPDRWTRAKVNHVDLYMRPEVPGDRMTRGQVGLAGAKLRIAMEAWLVDGHREWAIFACDSGDRDYLAKAHVQEGVWPLDRLVRTPLVWNSDGTPVPPEATVPGDSPVGGTPGRVMLGTRGRAGLQAFNGSEGRIRGTHPPREGWSGKVNQPVTATAGETNELVNLATTAFMAADDSAYPSIRAMLPWTHPEALNPFYQGMENMNFNADLYRYVSTYGLRLAERGHPEARRFIAHGETSFDMALDRYVYPESGCWEESHGYAGHTIHTVHSLVQALANSGYKDFREDVRFARMVEFFLYVHSPVDPEFGCRVVPPVGDHGLSTKGPSDRFGGILNVFTGAENPEVRKIVRRAAWMIEEDGGKAPAGVRTERPDLTSRWLRGYGAVMRADSDDRTRVDLTLKGALVLPAKGDKKAERRDLHLSLPLDPGGALTGTVRGKQPTYNQGETTGTVKVEGSQWLLDLVVGDDKWIKGGPARYTVDVSPKTPAATYRGTFGDTEIEGTTETADATAESFLVLRAGQSWGHHHEDKGSLWFWGRNVHFFGDCDWGSPPGGTYWNKYKQGPSSGTQIEFVGINNWTLPCKYPAPFVSDEEYNPETGYDYVDARCLYPYNPKLDLSTSTPVGLRNGYDRQVLFVHPDALIVRDNVETSCPAIWRLHSYQPEGTAADGPAATLASPQGVTAHLAILHPASGVKLRTIDRDILNDKYHDDAGHPLPYEELPRFKRSVELRWDMPPETSTTWVVALQPRGIAKAPVSEALDPEGRVTRVRLGDGTEIVALMSIEPFAWTGEGIDFEGAVGLVVRKDGKTTAHPIRATKLEAR